MFREITRIGNYSINVINPQRLMLMWNGERLCKYDNNADGVHDIIDDFVEMAIDEKLVKASNRKTFKAETVNAIANFAF